MALSPQALPALRGGLLALLAAALFGASTPLVQRFGAGLGAFGTAALLYAGAAVVGLLSRQRAEREARLRRGDLPRLLAIGATGYGLSLRFYLLAQRAFGAARTGSVFAFAPFMGAALAVALGDRSASGLMLLASMLMLGGVVLHLAESHAHEHVHEALAHEHAHRHDDGHHQHGHAVMPAGEHSHWHRHEPLRHAHPHVPDAHHAHRH